LAGKLKFVKEVVITMKLEQVGDDVYACVPNKAASGHSSAGLVDAGGARVSRDVCSEEGG